MTLQLTTMSQRQENSMECRYKGGKLSSSTVLVLVYGQHPIQPVQLPSLPQCESCGLNRELDQC